jgi:hypothetical protein
MEGINLESSRTTTEMTKGKAKKGKESKASKPEELSASAKAYIAALEAELADQHLRVLLYQGIISAASEQLGVDIVKKIGGHRSGP